MAAELSDLSLEALMASTPIAFAVADVSGHLVLVSPALQSFLSRPYAGLHKTDWVGAYDLYTADGHDRLRDEDVPLARALRGEVVTDAIIAIQSPRREDGKRYLRCNASPLLGDDDTGIGAVVLIQDVTAERIALNNQVALRRRLVDTINHELRTPMAKITGHAELLQDAGTGLPPAIRRSIDVVASAAEELMELAVIISELGDLESHSQLIVSRVDVCTLLSQVAEDLAGRAGQVGVEIRVECPASLTGTFDVLHARQAITALVDNALVHGPRGADVLLAAAIEDECLLISVTDRGTGMDSADWHRLIEPFERGDRPGHPLDGRGMGLAVAHTMAVSHGGDLAHHHGPSGSRVTISIPHGGTTSAANDADKPAP
jgi:signal transduction histidine kinase